MEVQKSRSVIVKQFGGYDSLLIEDFNLPKLEGNVEVEVEYGGLNFADLYTRQGLLTYKKPTPFVLGIECTGTITAIGVEGTDLKVGQKVICYDYQGGMYRDIIRVTPDKCFPLPEFIETQTGATIFVNYLTAYFVLIELGNLKKNEKVLILSCTGGVGCAATQLAKTIENVQVFGTGSSGKEEDAKKNGVDVFYTKEQLQTQVAKTKYDLIITNEVGSTFTFLQNALNPLGRIVAIGANNLVQDERKVSIFTIIKAAWSKNSILLESLITNNRVVAGFHLGTLLEQEPEKVKNALNYIFDLYRIGNIKPVIHSTLPMSKIVDASKLLGSRKNIGKVLISMKNETEE